MSRTNKLLTLNTHSLMEPDTEHCIRELCAMILKERPVVICLQEVNQPTNAASLDPEMARACGYVPCDAGMPLKEGNYACLVAERLTALGYPHQWTWAYAHLGYGKYDEGLAILSPEPMTATFTEWLSPRSYFLARRMVGAEVGGQRYYSVHLGWWADERDPLKAQIARIGETTDNFDGKQYLLGDFNSPYHVRGEGYDEVVSLSWKDCYLAAETKDDGITVGGNIDGWREKKVDPMRIDFCFGKNADRVVSSKVVFNGTNYPVVSDHYGVLTTVE